MFSSPKCLRSEWFSKDRFLMNCGFVWGAAVVYSQMASGGAVIAIREAEEASARDSINREEASYIYRKYSNEGASLDHDSSISRFANNTLSDDVEARLPSKKNLEQKANIRATDVQDTILRLNIGGSSYRIRTRSIIKFGPMTLLGRFVRMNHEHRRQWADWYFEESDEYFFERVPRYFDPIYDFYATGRLHVPKDLCFDKFMAELRFWAVSKSKMDECCSPFAQYCILPKAASESSVSFCFISAKRTTLSACDAPKSAEGFGTCLRDKPLPVSVNNAFRRWWKAFEITSTSFVVLSIAALILGSIPEFQVPEGPKGGVSTTQSSLTYPTYSKADGRAISPKVGSRNPDDLGPEMIEHPVFNYIENICVIYFTLEYIVRFTVAPRKWPFVRDFLNVIDLLAIAPFIFELVLIVVRIIIVGISGENVRKVRWAFLTVRLLRVLRVVRIAKLGRFSPGLANFALTIRKSKKQMQMVAIVMLTVVVFFSTLVYFLEKDEPKTTFTSIPASFWWAVVTMSTVGYGDSVPQTVAGKLIGSGAIVCGVMVLALPITIMASFHTVIPSFIFAIKVNNFMQVVKLREEKIIKKYAQQHGDQV
uniref:BTB domain-containing protein n=1 Tax=Ascaris lumbricoides TaxID=6252 RepID=A0A9J2PJ74_ASCLU